MNPLIGKQLELIEEIIQDLGTALERRRFAERRQTQERERLLQEAMARPETGQHAQADHRGLRRSGG